MKKKFEEVDFKNYRRDKPHPCPHTQASSSTWKRWIEEEIKMLFGGLPDWWVGRDASFPGIYFSRRVSASG